MYIFELIIKTLFQKKEKHLFDLDSKEQIEDYENCEHVFMPIDSTQETLSCTKCGIIKKRSDLKSKNFFIQN